MANYVYDEVKKELMGTQYRDCITSAVILNNMKKVAKEVYQIDVPGNIPEEKLDDYKEEVFKAVLNCYKELSNEALVKLRLLCHAAQLWKRLKQRKRICNDASNLQARYNINYDYASKYAQK